MNLTSGGALAGLAAVVTVVLLIAAIFGQFRISRNTQIVTNYREAAKAWEARSGAQEAEIQELKEANAAKDSRIGDLETQVTELRGHMKALQEMMIGAAALDQIRGDIKASEKAILAAIGATT